MQNRQFHSQTRSRHSRLLLAVFTAFALVASSGMFAAEAQAQGPGQFVFQGSGWGHGVGMSQNGARNAASNGASHVNILNFYYPNAIIVPFTPLDNIRVHIGDAERVELSSEGSITFERGGVAINAIPSGSITVSAHDGGLQIGNAWTTGSPNDPLFVSFPQPVKVANNGHRYLWGKLQITNKNGKVRVVEVLPLEDYVAGIAEMPAAWPLEALMAQAIAARTYAHEVTLHRRNSEEWAQEYDISGTTVDQNYIGYDAQDSAWDQKWLAAVKSTAGVELIDNNGPIRAYYSATNGGYTETAAYVFDNDVPYTVAGPDPYDEGGHPWTQWSRTYTQESMSRWLNAHGDTSVGTVTSINVGGGAGASGRIDKAVVEIVGTNGTKRVTGKRLMLVINAGVFGEGGGLSTHLPGTFTTVGNGAGVGFPVPTGAPVPTTITPDPVPEGTNTNDDFTPPPGWQPTPGTGVAPRGVETASAAGAAESGDLADASDAASAEDVATEARGTLAADGTYTPPAGWEPTPGSGVTPGGEVASTGEAAAVASDYRPPAGWEPTPGTGVAPRPSTATTSDAAAAPAASDDGGYTPPAGWQPEPGTGIFPNTTDTETVGGTGGGVALVDLPEGWEPEPGTGVAPRSRSAAPAEPAATETAATEPAETETAATETEAAPVTETAATEGEPAETVATSSASSETSYRPPAGWQPTPGTGVAPSARASTSSTTSAAQASGVFLVTRTATGTDLTDANFEVIAPTEDLADEARERLESLQAKAALGLFADVDVDGYVASVAPRPVHGVCTATADGITCVPLEALAD